jgi:TonB family protein
MKKIMLGALLAVATPVAQAGTTQDLESSAIVHGTIVLAKDGTVQSATIDDEAKYGKPIADMVHKAALQWLFYPILRDGKPVVAQSSMDVRVVLQKKPDGNYSARIKGATFGGKDMKSTDTLRTADGAKGVMPIYPKAAIRAHVQGTVYLALHVDRSGHVTEAVAEQVNLANTGSDRALKQYREIMAEATLKAARQWTFVVPTTGRLATQDSWTAHMPVSFKVNNLDKPAPASVWETYVPGPYTPAPWVEKHDVNATDVLADGDIRTEGAGPIRRDPSDHG